MYRLDTVYPIESPTGAGGAISSCTEIDVINPRFKSETPVYQPIKGLYHPVGFGLLYAKYNRTQLYLVWCCSMNWPPL